MTASGQAGAGGATGTPFQTWDRLDDEALDPPIRPLVRALNATNWVKTVFSCGGHPEEPDSVARGRRQAHVDVVVGDERRWREFASRCRRGAAEGVERLRVRAVRVRVAEGTLGTIPDWLAPALPGRPTRWQYRRLVFEPTPYAIDPDTCRSALDAALAAAVESLASLA
jgi:hypothetical protein